MTYQKLVAKKVLLLIIKLNEVQYFTCSVKRQGNITMEWKREEKRRGRKRYYSLKFRNKLLSLQSYFWAEHEQKYYYLSNKRFKTSATSGIQGYRAFNVLVWCRKRWNFLSVHWTSSSIFNRVGLGWVHDWICSNF